MCEKNDFDYYDPYDPEHKIIEREMTIQETIDYLKREVKYYEENHETSLMPMAEIEEYEDMKKQLNGEIPLKTYFIGAEDKRLEAIETAKDVLLYGNYNEIRRLSDEEIFKKVALTYLFGTDKVDVDDTYINQHLTVREQRYLNEGIKAVKETMDFAWVEAVIEKYGWAMITGDELFQLIKDAQKQLRKEKTKYLEELVYAGERILFTPYSSHFHHTAGMTLSEYVAEAKKFREEHWDFELK